MFVSEYWVYIQPFFTGMYILLDSLELRMCIHLTIFFKYLDQDGGWSHWTEAANMTESCTVSCGSGFLTETRNCDSPIKIGNGADCTGNDTRTSTLACVMPECGKWCVYLHAK